jgi:hypothetical protein
MRGVNVKFCMPFDRILAVMHHSLSYTSFVIGYRRNDGVMRILNAFGTFILLVLNYSQKCIAKFCEVTNL